MYAVTALITSNLTKYFSLPYYQQLPVKLKISVNLNVFLLSPYLRNFRMKCSETEYILHHFNPLCDSISESQCLFHIRVDLKNSYDKFILQNTNT